MQKAVGGAGFILTLMGVSGVIDHLWVQPVMGGFLNLVHRRVIERIDALDGYEVFANLTVAVLGVVLMILSDRLPEE